MTIQERNPTFNVHVYNNCAWVKTVSLLQDDGNAMVQLSASTSLEQKDGVAIPVGFYATGLRISGLADLGTAGEWAAQALFEFSYSHDAQYNTWGTSYDLSIMPGSDSGVGIGAWPYDPTCESKVCVSQGQDICPLFYRSILTIF